MSDIVVFGAGGVAGMAKRYIDLHGPDRIVGFTIDGRFKTSDDFEGLPLVPWEQLEEHFTSTEVRLLVPMSGRLQNEVRRDRYLEGKRRGYAFTSFVHPDNYNDAASIGENTFILMRGILEPGVRIGNGVMIWSGAHIGHHATIEDYCFLGGSVAVGAMATIGERTFLGSRTFIDANVTLGVACFIGSNGFVKQDLPPQSVVVREADPIKPYLSERIKRIT